MEKNELVSIIVPVYNASKYLEECIDSILNQTYSDIEIILVNDGSLDDSGEICDYYAALDERIIVSHQKNSGAACARKNGVHQARGKFVCFVDADDKIAPNMVEYFIANIGDCDLITSACECERSNKEKYIRYDAFAPGKYQTDEQMTYIIKNMITFENRYEDGFLPFLINKMYKTSVLNGIINTIDESIRYAEDRDLLFRYVLHCKSIRVTHECFYFYRCVTSSFMHSVNEFFMHDLNALYLSLRSEFMLHPLKESLICQLQIFISSRMLRISKYMGFGEGAQTVKYVFPLYNHLIGKRVILYGAGQVGRSYYRQFYNNRAISLLLWVDKIWERYCDVGMPVSSVEMIRDKTFDCIVIAVDKWDVQSEIKNEIMKLGIPEKKIWWEKPINIQK